MIRNYLIVGTLSMLIFASCKNQQSGNESIALKNDLDSMSYAIGMNIYQNVKKQGPDSMNTEAFIQGFRDGSKDKKILTEEQANTVLDNYFKKMNDKKYAETRKANEDWLVQNKTKEGVVTLPSGLQYKIIKEGNGAKPTINDLVKTHYKGTLIDGTVFDSSYDRNEPVTFQVGRVIPGWTEALQLMPVGSKWELYVPQELAYGDQGYPPIEPYSTLIFEIELLSIEKK